MKHEMVKIDSVRTTQEEGRLVPEIVKRSMEALFGGWDPKKVPPIKGYFYKDYVMMTDGHHRYAAALALGMKEVPVINESAMKRSDKSAYAAAIRKYRTLIEHPLAAI